MPGRPPQILLVNNCWQTHQEPDITRFCILGWVQLPKLVADSLAAGIAGQEVQHGSGISRLSCAGIMLTNANTLCFSLVVRSRPLDALNGVRGHANCNSGLHTAAYVQAAEVWASQG